MKAWQFTATGSPLTLVSLPDPQPGPDEVIVDVQAAGICHTDVGVLEDEKWLALIQTPRVMGHEAAGIVSAIGAEVTDLEVGDRVALFSGAEYHGVARDGGFEDKLAAKASSLVPVPDGLSFALAAASTDAGMTSYSAVMSERGGRAKAGDKIGIIGFGGLGQIGAQVAVLCGAEVYLAEVNETLWDRAYEAGVKQVAKDISEFADIQLDTIIDFAGFGTTTANAVEVVRFEGRVIQVGMGRLQAEINTYVLINNRVTLQGFTGGGVDDIAGVMGLMASGKLTPAVTEIGFDEIPHGIERVAKGEVNGRMVAVR